MLILYNTNCMGDNLRRIIQRTYTNIQMTYCANYLGEKFTGKWSDVDMFVYQHSIGMQEILDKLRPDCMQVSIPNVYNAGLFLIYSDQYPENIKNAESILQLKRAGIPLDATIRMLEAGHINFKIREKFDWSISKLKKHEEVCTIKCASDLILENYQRYRCFRTQNHPLNIITYPIANELLKIIGRPAVAISSDEIMDEIDKTEYPATPYEVEELGLPYEPTEGWKGCYGNWVKRIYAELV